MIISITPIGHLNTNLIYDFKIFLVEHKFVLQIFTNKIIFGSNLISDTFVINTNLYYELRYHDI